MALNSVEIGREVSKMDRVLYVDGKYVCQVVNWPPRNTERGWELSVMCEPELLGMFPRTKHSTFTVGNAEFTGLETVIGIMERGDEYAQATLIFNGIEAEL